jgi:6-phosphofructokinase 1
MGRSAGFLTAAAALARKFPDDGPHLVYLPERDFHMERFLSDVRRTVDRFGRCVVAVSEGIHAETGTPIAAQLAKQVERDAHGNIQLSGTGALAGLLCGQIKEKLGIERVRGDTFGYLQRSFAGCVSDVDQREARTAGETAVRYAVTGDANGSVVIERSGGDYGVVYRLVPLDAVAGKTRTMPDHFIATEGNDVTEAYHGYLRPLLGQSLPEAYRPAGIPVVKISAAGH